MPKEKKKNYGVVPTRQSEGEDFFYYVGKDDEVEVLETLGVSRGYEHSLGYNQKQSGYLEEGGRVTLVNYRRNQNEIQTSSDD